MAFEFSRAQLANFRAQIGETQVPLSAVEVKANWAAIFGTSSGRIPEHRKLPGGPGARAAVYLRPAVGEGDDLSPRLARFAEHCGRLQLDPVGAYADLQSKTTSVSDLPGLMRLLVAVKEGGVDVVVAQRSRNIFRSLACSGLVASVLRYNGVGLLFLEDGEVMNDPMALVFRDLIVPISRHLQ